jgi:Geminivirus Rep catalytic domain
LTYSKCALELETIITNLKEILSSYIVVDYILVREDHVTGEAHVHVFLKLLKKVNISSASFLDQSQNLFHSIAFPALIMLYLKLAQPKQKTKKLKFKLSKTFVLFP